ncbi:hypothetical protein M0812_10636 [Anaeramoeba flamelloides]|uniref:Uncharacterized protein n=1 Tax=Anaeramoeba flamelloides TaxID=1746091 RepID=A0AAV7ZXV3_9EUKA|nr:hypothetical protein M0812_10636 [Anaeramoeba flamelloides]
MYSPKTNDIVPKCLKFESKRSENQLRFFENYFDENKIVIFRIAINKQNPYVALIFFDQKKHIRKFTSIKSKIKFQQFRWKCSTITWSDLRAFEKNNLIEREYANDKLFLPSIPNEIVKNDIFIYFRQNNLPGFVNKRKSFRSGFWAGEVKLKNQKIYEFFFNNYPFIWIKGRKIQIKRGSHYPFQDFEKNKLKLLNVPNNLKEKAIKKYFKKKNLDIRETPKIKNRPKKSDFFVFSDLLLRIKSFGHLVW